MKRVFWVVLFFAALIGLDFSLVKPSSRRLVRKERSLLDLGSTFLCYRKSVNITLNDLNGYGCYCGAGGYGDAMDFYDDCCFKHDCCYANARGRLKCGYRVKLMPYKYKCIQGRTECKSENVCGREACECDRLFLECLTLATPNPQYMHYDKRRRCRGPMKSCPVETEPKEKQWRKNDTEVQRALLGLSDAPRSCLAQKEPPK
ncbi:Phospholipase A2 crotoxin basic subunit CBc [Acipenser ruthenus]|uniref:Phospholipase A2 n=1 Tax=Acipenser ruthenus TaxID=7906 RepID=A0A444UDP9_ACIRT|nr:basic phospholipase A2 VRV-PL-VIIIa-like [Acipenser ruthenus]RXM33303.1 Phospholipase A2 crotoxin basic subunit CBc [Acipenser ruthenus]